MEHPLPLALLTPDLPVAWPARAARRSGYTRRAVEASDVEPARPPGLQVEPAGVVPGTDDQALVCALGQGDGAALEALYERYSRGVYSLAMHILGDRGQAEEVVQETFVKLWRQPTAYRPDRGRLISWLLGVAHHRAVDLLRRRRTEQRFQIPRTQPPEDLAEELGLSVDGADPQFQLTALEQRLTVARALAQLPSDQRVPLELAYYRGLTQAEIAIKLGQPLGTIKARTRAALQRLRSAPGLVEAWQDR